MLAESSLLIVLVTTQDSVVAYFDSQNVDGTVRRVSVEADFLVGVDGIRSAVRKVLIGDEPRFLRCLNWNAIIPNPNQRWRK